MLGRSAVDLRLVEAGLPGGVGAVRDQQRRRAAARRGIEPVPAKAGVKLGTGGTVSPVDRSTITGTVSPA